MAKPETSAPAATFDQKAFDKALRRVTQDVKYLKANGAAALSADVVASHCADLVSGMRAAK